MAVNPNGTAGPAEGNDELGKAFKTYEQSIEYLQEMLKRQEEMTNTQNEEQNANLASSMLQIGLQISDKFNKMQNEIGEIRKEMGKLRTKNDKMKEEAIGKKIGQSSNALQQQLNEGNVDENFQSSALVPICGKPMYNKFQYCAKALFSQNRNYADIDFEAEYKKNKEILVLLDGCLTCYYWPERAANASIKLLSPFSPTQIKTQSDAYGDFKVGAIYKIEKKGQWQIQPKLEITHQCNQYGMTQKKTVLLPALQPNLMYQMTYEKLNAEIKLMQQGLPEKMEPLVFERNRTKPLDPPTIDVDAKKP